jgi:hypothetical protein
LELLELLELLGFLENLQKSELAQEPPAERLIAPRQ